MMRFSYQLPVVCFLMAICFLSSCNTNKNQPPVVGELDTAGIAADTLMQLGMESSYEVHHTVVIHKDLVYDILASGTASKGDYVILRRAENNKADTVARGERIGKVIGFSSSPGKNGGDQIQFYLQKMDSSKSAYAIAWEFDKQGNGKQVFDKSLDSVAMMVQ